MIWTNELLDALRQIGDPPMDPRRGNRGWRGVPFREAGKNIPLSNNVGRPVPEEVRLLQEWRSCQNGALPEEGAEKADFWLDVNRSMDPVQLEIAYSLFAVYGGEIGASLLLASLPNAYAAEAGAAVLNTTGELETNTRRRIAETAQLVVDVLFPDAERLYECDPPTLAEIDARPSLLPGGRAFVRARTTRLTHAVIRELISTKAPWDPTSTAKVPARPATLRGVPINQEDLLGTLGTFTVTTFEVMEKLGVAWSDEAETAYLHHWDRVGELLGIGTAEVTDALKKQGFDLPEHYRGALRPKTPAEARQLQQLIRDRCWPLPLPQRVLGPFANRNGKLLVRSLLDELQSAMPRGLERLPAVVMRYLVHDTAHELLGLGGGGVPDSILRWPSEQRFTRRPGPRVGKAFIERSMRLAATDVSRRAFVHFIRNKAGDPNQADFWFPAVSERMVAFPTGRGGA